jgi:hypothetical protein
MQHLDEGTIHAWLDGELPFEESSRVTAHAEVCDKCTAMIAEARGFLAASSRILGNLDEVPGDVIPPGHAPATSPGGTSLTPRDLGIVLPVGRTSGPRRWVPSRFAAAAAVAVLAVGTYTILNRSNAPALSEFSSPTADVAQRAEVDLKDSTALSAANEAAPPTTGSERTAPGSGAATPSTVAPPPVPTVPTPMQVAARKDEAAESAGRAADARARDAAAATTRPTEAERRAPPPAAQLAEVRIASAADSAAKKVDLGGVAGRRDTASVLAADGLRAAARQAAQPKALAVPPESVITTERRRLVGEVDSRLQNVVVTGAAASTERREVAKALPEISSGKSLTLRTAPGCYDIMRGDAEMQAGVPPSVRLANAQIRVGKRALRLAVPQGQAAAGRDVRWYWSLGGGRITLHKVAGGVVEYEGQIVAVRRTC